MSQRSRKLPQSVLSMVLVAATASVGWAQFGAGMTTSPPPLTGSPTMTPLPPGNAIGPSSTAPPPTYDPYSSQSGSSLTGPSLLGVPPGAYGTGTSAPYTYGTAPYTYGTAPNTYGTAPPTYGTPPPTYGTPPPTYGTPPAPYGQPGFSSQSPPALFPSGMFGTAQMPGAPVATAAPLKLFQNARLSYAWLYGDSNNADDLAINDMYVTTTMALPNFLWSGQPWYISPGFGLHLWSGPYGPQYVAFPSKAYSLFLDLGWKSDPSRAFGLELSGRLGYFSDFDYSTSDSFRPMGVALIRYNLTPTLALKAGVDYINRANIKMLPAGGFLWTPNPKTRFDIYFPQPKLESYLTTLGTRELWWYIGGEYGDGVWTVALDDSDPTTPGLQPGNTLMDINDYRVFLGLEFGAPGVGGIGQRGGFIEIGYVFEREVVLAQFPENGFQPSTTWMLRGGFSY